PFEWKAGNEYITNKSRNWYFMYTNSGCRRCGRVARNGSGIRQRDLRSSATLLSALDRQPGLSRLFLAGLQRTCAGRQHADTGAVRAAERHQHDVRSLLGDHVAAVAQVARANVDPDRLAAGRLVPEQMAPPLVVPPVDADLVRPARRLEIASVPELHRGRAVPLALDVHAHPERVLERAAAEPDVRPAIRTVAPIEVHEDGAVGEIDAGDRRGLGPALEVGRV